MWQRGRKRSHAAITLLLLVRATYDVCLKSKTVGSARVMRPFGNSAVRYNVGQPLMSVQLQFQISVFTVLSFAGLFVVSLAWIVVKNLGPQFLL